MRIKIAIDSLNVHIFDVDSFFFIETSRFYHRISHGSNTLLLSISSDRIHLKRSNGGFRCPSSLKLEGEGKIHRADITPDRRAATTVSCKRLPKG